MFTTGLVTVLVSGYVGGCLSLVSDKVGAGASISVAIVTEVLIWPLVAVSVVANKVTKKSE
jgi:hypothetical protein